MNDTWITRLFTVYGVFALQFVVLIYFLPQIYSSISTSEYMVYGIAITSTSLLQIICFGYPQSIIRDIIARRATNTEPFVVCNTFTFCATVLISIMFFLGCALIYMLNEHRLAVFFFVMTFCFYIANETVHSFLLGYEMFTQSRLIKSLEYLSLILSLVATFKYGSVNIVTISLSYLFSSIVNFCVAIVFFNKISLFVPNLRLTDYSPVRSLWDSSKWYLIGGGVVFLIFASDNYIMPGLLAASTFVYFQPFMKAADATRTVLSQIMSVFFTDIARLKEENRFKELLVMKTRLQFISIVGSIFVLTMAVYLGKDILGWWLEKEISEEQHCFFVACIIFILFHIIDSVPSTFAGALGIHRPVIIVAGIQAFIKVSTVYVLVKSFGAISFPVAGAIAFILTNFIYTPVHVRKYLRKSIDAA